jgi:hypothetical protein
MPCRTWAGVPSDGGIVERVESRCLRGWEVRDRIQT